MNAKDLREKTNEELRALLEEKRKDLVNFRLKLITGVVDNVRMGREIRKDIARILTILRERELKDKSAEAKSKGRNRNKKTIQ